MFVCYFLSRPAYLYVVDVHRAVPDVCGDVGPTTREGSLEEQTRVQDKKLVERVLVLGEEIEELLPQSHARHVGVMHL